MLFASIDQTTINRTCRYSGEVKCLSGQSGDQRSNVLYVRSSNCEAGHAPKINWLLEGLFQILQIDLRQFHNNTDLLSLRFRPCRSDYRWLFHPRQEEPVDSQRRPPALTIPCRACMPGVYRPTACPELRAQFPA